MSRLPPRQQVLAATATPTRVNANAASRRQSVAATTSTTHRALYTPSRTSIAPKPTTLGRLKHGETGDVTKKRKYDPMSSSKISRSTSDTTVGIASTGGSEEAVKVAVRVRPIVPEGNKCVDRAWGVSTEQNSIVNLSSESKDPYEYDQVFGENSNTRELYDPLVSDVVSSVTTKDINGTVFTYGQTGSGKTFTMQGCKQSESSEGIIQLAARDIFQSIEERQVKDDYEIESVCTVRVSYVEIYNEELRDLLKNDSSRKPSSSLEIREDKQGVTIVEGLKEVVVKSLEDLMKIFKAGEKKRSVGSTKMNDRSSRSHAILSITLERKTTTSAPKYDANEQKENSDHNQEALSNLVVVTTTSTLNLVDLAGSESVRHTNAVGKQKEEGGMINKSLLTLSMVLMCLGQKTPEQHIKYRNSKLTRILKPSLSGNARMVVVCCISPSNEYSQETQSTLQFALRAKLVKTNAIKNEKFECADLFAQQKLELVRCRGESEKLTEMLRERSDQLRECNDELRATLEELGRSWSVVNTLKGQLQERDDQHVVLKEQHVATLEELGRSRSLVNTLKEQLQERDDQHDVLKEQHDATLEELGNRRSEVYTLEGQLQELKDQLRELKASTALHEHKTTKTTNVATSTSNNECMAFEKLARLTDTSKEESDNSDINDFDNDIGIEELKEEDDTTDSATISTTYTVRCRNLSSCNLSSVDLCDNEEEEVDAQTYLKFSNGTSVINCEEEDGDIIMTKVLEKDDNSYVCINTDTNSANPTDASSVINLCDNDDDDDEEEEEEKYIDNEIIANDYDGKNVPTAITVCYQVMKGNKDDVDKIEELAIKTNVNDCEEEDTEDGGCNQDNSEEETLSLEDNDRDEEVEFDGHNDSYGSSSIRPIKKRSRTDSTTMIEDSDLTKNDATQQQPSGSSHLPEKKRAFVPWDTRFKDLCDFQIVNGNLNVPRDNPLNKWMCKQRTLHRQGKLPKEDDRFKKLEGIGFDFNPQREVKWDKRFNELKQYKEEYGHCNVPRDYTKLGSWVHLQRTSYWNFKNGKPCQGMNAKRIRLLNDLGFVWDVYEDNWEDGFTNLTKYKEEHGHCNVPQRYAEDPSLGHWVRNQRTNYSNLLENKPCKGMNDERISKLDELEFTWSIRSLR